jgi:hypothetical protein
MTDTKPGRAHLVTAGFPLGPMAELDQGLADRGLWPMRSLTRHRAPLCTRHLTATRRHDPCCRLYPRGRQRRGRLLCARPFSQPGHSRGPARRARRHNPLTFHGSWETPAFITLLRNAIAWGVI